MTGSLRSQTLKLPMTATEMVQNLILTCTYSDKESRYITIHQEQYSVTLLFTKNNISNLLVSKLEV